MSHLYHYTTHDGLMGILESKSLWATHYKFLNDKTEIELGKGLILKFMQMHLYKKHPKLNKDRYNIICNLIKESFSDLGNEFFIFSLCCHETIPGRSKDEITYIKDHGLLSQWRGYGKDGGYAIVFKHDSLRDAGKKHIKSDHYNIVLSIKSKYSLQDKKQFFKESLKNYPNLNHFKTISDYYDKVINAMETHNPNNLPYDRESIYNFFHALINIVGSIKHVGFKEENEVRFLFLRDFPSEINQNSNISTQDLLPIKFDGNKGRPYVIFNFHDLKAIDKIIVGPHREQKNRVQFLEMYMKQHNLNIKISASSIPYAC